MGSAGLFVVMKPIAAKYDSQFLTACYYSIARSLILPSNSQTELSVCLPQLLHAGFLLVLRDIAAGLVGADIKDCVARARVRVVLRDLRHLHAE